VSARSDFAEVLAHLEALQAIMEPSGGGVPWEGQPPARVKGFLVSAAAVTWCLGVASESILSGVEVRVCAAKST